MDHSAQLRHPGALEQRAESIGDDGKKWDRTGSPVSIHMFMLRKGAEAPSHRNGGGHALGPCRAPH